MSSVDIREVRLSDASFLYDLFQCRNEKDKLTDIGTRKDNFNFVSSYLTSKRHPFQHWFVVMYMKQRAGTITMSRKDNELGWWLLPEFQGRGIMPEALRTFMETVRAEKYTAKIRVDNPHSLSLARSFGFVATHHVFSYVP